MAQSPKLLKEWQETLERRAGFQALNSLPPSSRKVLLLTGQLSEDNWGENGLRHSVALH